jgi:hypothetical protein
MQEQTDFIEEAGLNVTGGVKNLFLGFLQEFFSQQQKWTYSPDEAESDILIVDKMPNDLSVLEKQPVVVLNRGSIRPMNATIDKVAKRKTETGSIEYSDMFTGTINFNCIARLGLEAEELGTRVALALITFEKLLRRRGIHQYQDVTIGEEALVEADSDVVGSNCPVTLRYQAQFTWELVHGDQELSGADIVLCLDQDKLRQEITLDDEDDNND